MTSIADLMAYATNRLEEEQTSSQGADAAPGWRYTVSSDGRARLHVSHHGFMPRCTCSGTSIGDHTLTMQEVSPEHAGRSSDPDPVRTMPESSVQIQINALVLRTDADGSQSTSSDEVDSWRLSDLIAAVDGWVAKVIDVEGQPTTGSRRPVWTVMRDAGTGKFYLCDEETDVVVGALYTTETLAQDEADRLNQTRKVVLS